MNTITRNTPLSLGKLEIICGPMFSGKSEELIKRLRRAKIAQKKFLHLNMLLMLIGLKVKKSLHITVILLMQFLLIILNQY